MDIFDFLIAHLFIKLAILDYVGLIFGRLQPLLLLGIFISLRGIYTLTKVEHINSVLLLYWRLEGKPFKMIEVDSFCHTLTFNYKKIVLRALNDDEEEYRQFRIFYKGCRKFRKRYSAIILSTAIIPEGIKSFFKKSFKPCIFRNLSN